MIRVVIADDQTLLREGLQTIINLEEDMRTAGLAANGAEAVSLTEETSPHVVLMDIKMPVMNGIEGMKNIKSAFPETLVLMLTTFLEDDLIVDAMASGADGFLLKDMAGEQIVQTIREAIRGTLILPAPIAAKLAAKVRSWQSADGTIWDERKLKEQGLYFNERERQIVALVLKGMTNREISSMLYMSEGTVRNYVSVVYGKIGTNERAAAIARLKEYVQI